MPNFVISTPSNGADNFSLRDVVSTKSYIVPLAQQMLVYQEFSVQDGGELDLEGELVVID